MVDVASVWNLAVTWCCELLGVVSQSLKPDKLLANGRNNTQQCLELFVNNVSSVCTRL